MEAEEERGRITLVERWREEKEERDKKRDAVDRWRENEEVDVR